jgi:DNA-binding transcriptional ArsR family regulator
MTYANKRDLILKLGAEGKNYTQIREITGASKSTISYHLGANGSEKTRTIATRRARRGAVNDLKEKNPCNDCGNFYPYFIMEYDHLDETTKKAPVSFLIKSAPFKEVEEEIAKCELVCSNCHKQRTWFRSKLKQLIRVTIGKLQEKDMSKNSEKRKLKNLEHAEYVWAREQLQAAAAHEALMDAFKVIEENQDTLTEEQMESLHRQVDIQKAEIEDFVMTAKAKYENKLAELQ